MASNEKKLVREQLRSNRAMLKEISEKAAELKTKKELLKKERVLLTEKAKKLGLTGGAQKAAAKAQA